MRDTRCQGAIVRAGRQLLVIQHREHSGGRTYWVIPGGGAEPGESPEDCVRREMREETNLDVRVERLLLDSPAHTSEMVYQRYLTYLCTPLTDNAQPGYEPEPEAASNYAIAALAWIDLADESSWNPAIKADPITYPQLQRICAALV